MIVKHAGARIRPLGAAALVFAVELSLATEQGPHHRGGHVVSTVFAVGFATSNHKEGRCTSDDDASHVLVSGEASLGPVFDGEGELQEIRYLDT
jgi:hypothetical protein